jgi:hypothetical protein
MPTIESIAVLVDSLLTRQDELKKDVRELRADNRSIRERLDAVHLMLSKRIDAVEARRNG